MGFGLTFSNNDSVVTLDSEFARLVVIEKGTWSGDGSGVGISFATVVTTDEPPLIFVRPNQSNTFCFCKVSGGAGNWTGFSFSGIVGQGTTGNWFTAAFKSNNTAKYGMRLWGSSANLLFDNGTPCAQFTRTIQGWAYLGSSNTGQGQSRLSWTADSPLNTGDYMLLNNVAMDIAGSVSRQGNLYAVWQYEDNRLLMQAVGVDLVTSLYVPVVFAKPV